MFHTIKSLFSHMLQSSDNSYAPWTKEEHTILLQFLADGKSYKQIAKHLNRTPNAVYQRYRLLERRAHKELTNEHS